VKVGRINFGNPPTPEDKKQQAIDAERDAMNRQYHLGPYSGYKICPHCGAKKE